MRHRTQARRKPQAADPAPPSAQKRTLQSRPFAPPPPTQAQQERIARPRPTAADIPLQPAPGTQQRPPAEPNLMPLEGTAQRQQAQAAKRAKQLRLPTEPAVGMEGIGMDSNDAMAAIAVPMMPLQSTQQESLLQSSVETNLKDDEEIVHPKTDESEEFQAKLERKLSQADA